MTEQGGDGLMVDAGLEKPCGCRFAQVMDAQANESRRLDCRCPHPGMEVAVGDSLARGTHEERLVGVLTATAGSGQILRDDGYLILT